jgi:hypothetical protein
VGGACSLFGIHSANPLRAAAGDIDLSHEVALELDDGTSVLSPTTPDWGRIVLNNVPAAVALLVGIVAVDMATGFDIARIAVRYGGPGAPPTAIAAFWVATILGMGTVSSLITAFVVPGSYVLKGACPECGAENKGYFDDVFGIVGGQSLSHCECTNCMADLEFDINNGSLAVVVTSSQKKAAALERGRRAALEEAKREAQAIMEQDRY